MKFRAQPLTAVLSVVVLVLAALAALFFGAPGSGPDPIAGLLERFPLPEGVEIEIGSVGRQILRRLSLNDVSVSINGERALTVGRIRFSASVEELAANLFKGKAVYDVWLEGFDANLKDGQAEWLLALLAPGARGLAGAVGGTGEAAPSEPPAGRADSGYRRADSGGQSADPGYRRADPGGLSADSENRSADSENRSADSADRPRSEFLDGRAGLRIWLEDGTVEIDTGGLHLKTETASLEAEVGAGWRILSARLAFGAVGGSLEGEELSAEGLAFSSGRQGNLALSARRAEGGFAGIRGGVVGLEAGIAGGKANLRFDSLKLEVGRDAFEAMGLGAVLGGPGPKAGALGAALGAVLGGPDPEAGALGAALGAVLGGPGPKAGTLGGALGAVLGGPGPGAGALGAAPGAASGGLALEVERFDMALKIDPYTRQAGGRLALGKFSAAFDGVEAGLEELAGGFSGRLGEDVRLDLDIQTGWGGNGSQTVRMEEAGLKGTLDAARRSLEGSVSAGRMEFGGLEKLGLEDAAVALPQLDFTIGDGQAQGTFSTRISAVERQSLIGEFSLEVFAEAVLRSKEDFSVRLAIDNLRLQHLSEPLSLRIDASRAPAVPLSAKVGATLGGIVDLDADFDGRGGTGRASLRLKGFEPGRFGFYLSLLPPSAVEAMMGSSIDMDLDLDLRGLEPLEAGLEMTLGAKGLEAGKARIDLDISLGCEAEGARVEVDRLVFSSGGWNLDCEGTLENGLARSADLRFGKGSVQLALLKLAQPEPSLWDFEMRAPSVPSLLWKGRLDTSEEGLMVADSVLSYKDRLFPAKAKLHPQEMRVDLSAEGIEASAALAGGRLEGRAKAHGFKVVSLAGRDHWTTDFEIEGHVEPDAKDYLVDLRSFALRNGETRLLGLDLKAEPGRLEARNITIGADPRTLFSGEGRLSNSDPEVFLNRSSEAFLSLSNQAGESVRLSLAGQRYYIDIKDFDMGRLGLGPASGGRLGLSVLGRLGGAGYGSLEFEKGGGRLSCSLAAEGEDLVFSGLVSDLAALDLGNTEILLNKRTKKLSGDIGIAKTIRFRAGERRHELDAFLSLDLAPLFEHLGSALKALAADPLSVFRPGGDWPSLLSGVEGSLEIRRLALGRSVFQPDVLALSLRDGRLAAKGALIDLAYDFRTERAEAAIDRKWGIGLRAEGLAGPGRLDLNLRSLSFPLVLLNDLIDMSTSPFVEGEATGFARLLGGGAGSGGSGGGSGKSGVSGSGGSGGGGKSGSGSGKSGGGGGKSGGGPKLFGNLYAERVSVSLFWVPDTVFTITNATVALAGSKAWSPPQRLLIRRTDTNRISYGTLSTGFDFASGDWELGLEPDGPDIGLWIPIPSLSLDGRANVGGSVRIGARDGMGYIEGDVDVERMEVSFDLAEDGFPAWYLLPAQETRYDLNVRTVAENSLFYPTRENPVLRLRIKDGENFHFAYRTDTGDFDASGSIALMGGDIYYFQRNFLVTEGKLAFGDRIDLDEGKLDISVDLQAKLTSYDSDGEKVDILLTLQNSPLDKPEPRFTSIPAMNEQKIMTILGKSLLPSSAFDVSGAGLSSLASVTAAMTSVAGRLRLIPMGAENFGLSSVIRDSLGLDLFTVSSNLVQNIFLDVIPRRPPAAGLSPLARYLDGTSIFAGKRLAPNLFAKAAVGFRADPPPRRRAGTGLGGGGLRIDFETSLEWETPLAVFTVFARPRELSVFDLFDTMGFSVTRSLRL